MSNATIFWDVDTQVDFMHRGGKLYVPGAEDIIANLQTLTQLAHERHIPVIASMDAHLPDDPEFQQYPPHCLVGTPGQQKIPQTRLPRQVFIPNHPVKLPTTLREYDQVILEKQQLDVFTNPNAETLLGLIGTPRVVLYGVVTEICVDLTARALLTRGYNVSLVTDAIRHLDRSTVEQTLREIVRRGGKIVSTVEVVKSYSA